MIGVFFDELRSTLRSWLLGVQNYHQTRTNAFWRAAAIEIIITFPFVGSCIPFIDWHSVSIMTEEETTANNNDSMEVEATEPKPQNAVLFTPELLQVYYARLFPFDLLYQWLSYYGSNTFNRREFSFTLDKSGEEIYMRYQSFRDSTELAQAIHKRRPVKIDIGAVYSHPPSDKNAFGNKFVPESRELVFDIDLTDYDEVRKCGCSGANICRVCWKYMQMAIDVMDETLADDFGFEHVAWFYSGRRGVHCWVCDETARELTDPGRSAIANYIGVRAFDCFDTLLVPFTDIDFESTGWTGLRKEQGHTAQCAAASNAREGI